MRHHPLEDIQVPGPTRRRLLQGAPAGAVSAGILAAPARAGRHAHGESPEQILSLLATAESFGVTFLTEAVRRAPGTPGLAEGCAIESEHRAIARFAQTALAGRQQIAINRSFAPRGIRTAAGMIAALESAGIGFGRRGATPGAFHELPGDPARTGAGLENDGRRPDEP